MYAAGEWGNHVTSREQLDGQVLSGDATALLLERAGIPTARSTFAAGVDDVAAAFAALSASTAVLKVSGLLHKTESGGVVLGLQSAEAATAAAEKLYARMGPAGLPFLLQEQASRMEMLVGLHRDPQLGAAVVVGLGGVQAEIHNDVAHRFAPVTCRVAPRCFANCAPGRCWTAIGGRRLSTCRRCAASSPRSPPSQTATRDQRTRPQSGHCPRDGNGCVAVDARIITWYAPAPATPEAPPGAQPHRCRGRV